MTEHLTPSHKISSKKLRNQVYSPAKASLILAGLSWLGFAFITAIPSLMISKKELEKSKQNEITENNRQYTRIAFWMSAINLVVSILIGGFLWFLSQLRFGF